MPSLPPISRTTSLMTSNALLAQLQATQRRLFSAQEQITTGNAFSRASDVPDKVSTILFLERQLAERSQHSDNLLHARNMLGTADQVLGDATNLLIEARDIASSQVGVGSDSETRKTEAVVIDAQVRALLDLANRQFSDMSLFGGNNGARPDGAIFEEFLGGIRYLGSDSNLQNDVGLQNNEDFSSNGVDAFGALSTRVRSEVDLLPQPTAGTKIGSVGGTDNLGVSLGSVVVTVNGADQAVDLSTADTVGDVVTRINEAITALSPGAGSLALAGAGFELTAAGGNTVTISESGQGITASDLGIDLTATGATVAGGSINTKLSRTTALADLGAAVDFASGLQITQGETTKTADFSAATTIEDLINEIDSLRLGLRMEINAEGTGLDLVTEVSGIAVSIGENGGTTAQDLGLRTLGTNTSLNDFRFGIGVHPKEGEDDLTISLHDGTSFGVDLFGAATVQDVIDAIGTAATGAGLTLGTDFTVGLATTGNGLAFEDLTAGGNDFVIANANTSLAGDHLGITTNAGAGNTIVGDDNSKVRVENAFTHLINLRNSLTGDSTSGITLAASGLEDDIDQLVAARAVVGVQAKRIEDQQIRAEDMELTEKSMLSTLKDAELTEVISQFTQLQTQLQASLSVGAQNLQLSLLDFLR